MPTDELESIDLEARLLRTFVDRIPAMVAYWDAAGRCRFANREYESWFGAKPGSLIGKHIGEVLGPLYPINRSFIEGALRGEPQEFDRDIPDTRGGPSRHSHAIYIPDVAEGAVRGFFVLVTDISAMQRTELALRESEERFRLTIDEAPIGMALVTPDGRFVRVNRALCEIVGYSADELTGLTFQAITHPDDLDADLELLGQLARGEIQRYQLGKRYIRKDGTTVSIMLSVAVLRGPDGAPTYFIGQIEDVTEQKRAESEQRFLAEVGPELASSLDYQETANRIADLAVREIADLCIIEVIAEDGTVERLRVSCRDPGKRWLCEMLTGIRLDRHRPRLLGSVLETGRPAIMQLPSDATIAALAQSDEHLRALRAAQIRSMVAVPLVAHGRLVGAMAFVSSSSSRLYGPADVRMAQELGQRAALSIENARLYLAATKATEARDELLGIVAHDLRNPLGNILMQARLLRRRSSAPDRRSGKPADAIERAASRMNRLIQDLLDVTRIEAGRSVEPVRLRTELVITDCAEAQRELAASASIELRLEIASNLPEVWGDRDRLSQVFENLMGNAFKFTPPGGRVVLGAAPRGREVLFWVSDTGSGMDVDDLPHLFDRFWQGRKARRQGAGLGLPIVKGIVEAHAGRIWVESAPGQGSTFFFTIPAAPRLETERNEPAPHE